MYYPLLRGRQNELLAIKELLDASALRGLSRILCNRKNAV